MLTAAHRRRAVEHLKNSRYSERRACRLVGFSRSASWRPLKAWKDEPLRSCLKQLAERYPRYGYPTLHNMLKTEGLVVNPKRTYRLYREEDLQIRTRRRKKLDRPRIPMLAPDSINQRRPMDFASERLANGSRVRILNIVDDYSREIVLQIVDFSISGYRLAREPDQLECKLPKTIVCDNGPEFTCNAMFFRAKKTGTKIHFIQPGKPTQNAFIESFNGKFREYCVDVHWFARLAYVQSTIDDWRSHFNHVRPHRSLGKNTADSVR